MIRMASSLERLASLKPEDKVGYRYGQGRAALEATDYAIAFPLVQRRSAIS